GVRSTGRGKSKPTSPTCERVASAISMIGLHPERPQRGKGASTNLQRLAANFEDEFSRHCITCDHGRPTPEKRLQSYLLASAYRSHRHMVDLRTEGENPPSFITDELALPVEGGRIVCD